uniref:GAT domain-containing protein n=1 Tax=Macrostomum lignano TaxID=282301 RepID=A0A1I8GY82_9PLAT
ECKFSSTQADKARGEAGGVAGPVAARLRPQALPELGFLQYLPSLLPCLPATRPAIRPPFNLCKLIALLPQFVKHAPAELPGPHPADNGRHFSLLQSLMPFQAKLKPESQWLMHMEGEHPNCQPTTASRENCQPENCQPTTASRQLPADNCQPRKLPAGKLPADNCQPTIFRLAVVGWQLSAGSCRLAVVGWQFSWLAIVGWQFSGCQLSTGSCRLAIVGWQFSGWQLGRLRAGSGCQPHRTRPASARDSASRYSDRLDDGGTDNCGALKTFAATLGKGAIIEAVQSLTWYGDEDYRRQCYSGLRVVNCCRWSSAGRQLTMKVCGAPPLWPGRQVSSADALPPSSPVVTFTSRRRLGGSGGDVTVTLMSALAAPYGEVASHLRSESESYLILRSGHRGQRQDGDPPSKVAGQVPVALAHPAFGRQVSEFAVFSEAAPGDVNRRRSGETAVQAGVLAGLHGHPELLGGHLRRPQRVQEQRTAGHASQPVAGFQALGAVRFVTNLMAGVRPAAEVVGVGRWIVAGEGAASGQLPLHPAAAAASLRAQRRQRGGHQAAVDFQAAFQRLTEEIMAGWHAQLNDPCRRPNLHSEVGPADANLVAGLDPVRPRVVQTGLVEKQAAIPVADRAASRRCGAPGSSAVAALSDNSKASRLDGRIGEHRQRQQLLLAGRHPHLSPGGAVVGCVGGLAVQAGQVMLWRQAEADATAAVEASPRRLADPVELVSDGGLGAVWAAALLAVTDVPEEDGARIRAEGVADRLELVASFRSAGIGPVGTEPDGQKLRGNCVRHVPFLQSVAHRHRLPVNLRGVEQPSHHQVVEVGAGKALETRLLAIAQQHLVLASLARFISSDLGGTETMRELLNSSDFQAWTLFSDVVPRQLYNRCATRNDMNAEDQIEEDDELLEEGGIGEFEAEFDEDIMEQQPRQYEIVSNSDRDLIIRAADHGDDFVELTRQLGVKRSTANTTSILTPVENLITCWKAALKRELAADQQNFIAPIAEQHGNQLMATYRRDILYSMVDRTIGCISVDKCTEWFNHAFRWLPPTLRIAPRRTARPVSGGGGRVILRRVIAAVAFALLGGQRMRFIGDSGRRHRVGLWQRARQQLVRVPPMESAADLNVTVAGSSGHDAALRPAGAAASPSCDIALLDHKQRQPPILAIMLNCDLCLSDGSKALARVRSTVDVGDRRRPGRTSSWRLFGMTVRAEPVSTSKRHGLPWSSSSTARPLLDPLCLMLKRGSCCSDGSGSSLCSFEDLHTLRMCPTLPQLWHLASRSLHCCRLWAPPQLAHAPEAAADRIASGRLPGSLLVEFVELFGRSGLLVETQVGNCFSTVRHLRRRFLRCLQCVDSGHERLEVGLFDLQQLCTVHVTAETEDKLVAQSLVQSADAAQIPKNLVSVFSDGGHQRGDLRLVSDFFTDEVFLERLFHRRILRQAGELCQVILDAHRQGDDVVQLAVAQVRRRRDNDGVVLAAAPAMPHQLAQRDARAGLARQQQPAASPVTLLFRSFGPSFIAVRASLVARHSSTLPLTTPALDGVSVSVDDTDRPLPDDDVTPFVSFLPSRCQMRRRRLESPAERQLAAKASSSRLLCPSKIGLFHFANASAAETTAAAASSGSNSGGERDRGSRGEAAPHHGEAGPVLQRGAIPDHLALVVADVVEGDVADLQREVVSGAADDLKPGQAHVPAVGGGTPPPPRSRRLRAAGSCGHQEIIGQAAMKISPSPGDFSHGQFAGGQCHRKSRPGPQAARQSHIIAPDRRPLLVYISPRDKFLAFPSRSSAAALAGNARPGNAGFGDFEGLRIKLEFWSVCLGSTAARLWRELCGAGVRLRCGSDDLRSLSNQLSFQKTCGSVLEPSATATLHGSRMLESSITLYWLSGLRTAQNAKVPLQTPAAAAWGSRGVARASRGSSGQSDGIPAHQVMQPWLLSWPKWRWEEQQWLGRDLSSSHQLSSSSSSHQPAQQQQQQQQQQPPPAQQQQQQPAQQQQRQHNGLAPEHLTKLRADVNVVQKNATVFAEMLAEQEDPAVTPEADAQLLRELAGTNQQMQARMLELIGYLGAVIGGPSGGGSGSGSGGGSGGSDSPGQLLEDLLRLNDQLNDSLRRFDRLRRAWQDLASGGSFNPMFDLAETAAPPASTMQAATDKLEGEALSSCLRQLVVNCEPLLREASGQEQVDEILQHLEENDENFHKYELVKALRQRLNQVIEPLIDEEEQMLSVSRPRVDESGDVIDSITERIFNSD